MRPSILRSSCIITEGGLHRSVADHLGYSEGLHTTLSHDCNRRVPASVELECLVPRSHTIPSPAPGLIKGLVAVVIFGFTIKTIDGCHRTII